MTLSKTEAVKKSVPFEDAMDATGFGKFNILMLFLCGGIIMSMVFESFSVSYLAPTSACELGTDSQQQGLMAGMPLIGFIATSHVWGYLADIYGRRRILMVSLMTGFSTGALATFSTGWIMLSILKLLSSSAVSGAYALSLTYLSECNPRNRRSCMLVLTTSIFLVCAGLMAMVTIPVFPLTFSYYIPVLKIYFNSWRLLNVLFCMPCALGTLGMYLAYESPKYLLTVGEEEKALEVLKGIYAMNTGKDRKDYQVESLTIEEDSGQKAITFWSSIKHQTIPLMKPPLIKNTIIMAILFILMYSCVNPIQVWLPWIADHFMRSVKRDEAAFTFCQRLNASHYLDTEVVHTQTSDCSLNQFAMLMVFIVDMILAVLNVVLSGVINCCGRKHLFIGIQLFTGAAALCVNLTTTWGVSAALFIVYLSAGLNFGVLATYCVDVFPTYLRAMAMCLTLMLGRGSAVIGINILNQIIISDCETTFYGFGSLAVLCGLIGFLLPSNKKIIENMSKTKR